MKTLDEVIKALEICKNTDINRSCKDCPMPDNQWCINYLMDDALHYLREYRKLDSLDAVAFPEDDNPAMTWDELRTMEGKPVWVEYLRDGVTYDAEWCIVKDIDDDLLHDTEGYGYGRANKYGDGYGVGWQAYRKERDS